MAEIEKLAYLAEQCEFEAESGTRVSGVSPHSFSKGKGLSSAQLQDRYGTDERGLLRGQSPTVQVNGHSIPIHMAVMPNGKRLPLLKTMLTSACERDCNYCSFRTGRDIRRETFHPQEMAEVYSRVFHAGRVQGLFLSTGILRGGANTQNRLLDTAEILRMKLEYTGYLHLKLMPGIERGQILRAMQLADRISLNLEAPTPESLSFLAPQKKFIDEIMTPLGWIKEIKRNNHEREAWGRRWPSVTTQFVVGPAGETDLELLQSAVYLNQTVDLQRAYFEAFGPVPGTPLENHPPELPIREHRLYQASFLLRDYGFDLEELPFGSSGMLPIEEDPKKIYAHKTYFHDPLEINQADREDLLRIPGIGPKTTRRLLTQRQNRTIRDLSYLRKMGVLVERAAPYITLAGKRPPIQLPLFTSQT